MTDEPYWEAASEGRLALQRCEACGALRWPPAPVCPECLSPAARWEDVEGGGTLWSLAVYERAFAAAFRDHVPYAVGLVQLDAGPRIIATVEGDDLAVGMRLARVTDAQPPGQGRPRFRPAP
jgi:uncharacterized OB-fold protein